MTKIEKLIDMILESETGSRKLDSEIAHVLGISHRDETNSQPLRNLSLVKDAGKIPLYTTSIESAYQLSQQVAPGNVGGYVWREGKASAQIGESGQVFWASTPALALCVAVLHVVSEKT